MKRGKLAAIVTLGVACVTALASVAAAEPPPAGPGEQQAQKTEVQVLALNDFHGQLRPPDATSSGGRIGATPAGGAEYLASTSATCGPPTRTRCSCRPVTSSAPPH